MSGFKIVFGLLACVLLVSAFETDIVGDNYIIGGRNANRYQFPWIVSLRNRQNNHFCGGFILSNRWIGSAAQCTLGNHAIPDNVIAATGAHTRTDGTRHRINRILNHPRFNRVTLTFDVSILQTADRIAVTPNGPIRAIRFPTGQVVHNGATVYIAGWGRAQESRNPGQGVPQILQWIGTRTMPVQQCRQRHGNNARMVHVESICTSNPAGQGFCGKDTGGPLVDAQGNCIGIASWSTGCARGLPDIYAKLWTAIPFYRQASGGTIPGLPQGP